MSDKKNQKTIHNEKQHGGGPKTPEGKARSAMNATRHGLTGTSVVLTTEDPEKFRELLADYMDHYAPANAVELDMVHEIAVARWRMQRIWGMEACMFEITMERDERGVNAEFNNCDTSTRMTLAYMSMAENKTSLATLLRYEARISRHYHLVIKELQDLQSKRKAEECQTNSATAVRGPVLVPKRPLAPNFPTPAPIPGSPSFDGKDPGELPNAS